MKQTIKIFLSIAFSLGVSGCKGFDLKSAIDLSQNHGINPTDGINSNEPVTGSEVLELLITDAVVTPVDMDLSFSQVMNLAVENDPIVMTARAEYNATRSTEAVLLSEKDFQVNGLIMGGVEDVTDKTAGLGVVLNANRMLFDGGHLAARIAAAQFNTSSARHIVHARLEERSYKLLSYWLDLERFEILNKKIDDRLNIVNPLILQLEEIAEAGVGDVSKVASAQRTLSGILVKKTELTQKLEKSRLDFLNSFGSMPGQTKFGGTEISKLVPRNLDDSYINKAPFLLADFDSYRAAEANLVAVKTSRSYKLGFESRLSRPVGGSNLDSDESVGVILSKTLYNGDMFDSQITQAEALVKTRASILRGTYREGKRTVESAMQNLASLTEAIQLAKENAIVTADEIAYLRRQLVIGGSTLDSVLQAEARLYDAEAKGIEFVVEKQKTEASILASLGLLAGSFGLKP